MAPILDSVLRLTPNTIVPLLRDLSPGSISHHKPQPKSSAHLRLLRPLTPAGHVTIAMRCYPWCYLEYTLASPPATLRSHHLHHINRLLPYKYDPCSHMSRRAEPAASLPLTYRSIRAGARDKWVWWCCPSMLSSFTPSEPVMGRMP